MALCTRNFDGPVNHLLETFLPEKIFHPIITRDFHPPKPDPAGLLRIAREWGLDDGARRVIMVRELISMLFSIILYYLPCHRARIL